MTKPSELQSKFLHRTTPGPPFQTWKPSALARKTIKFPVFPNQGTPTQSHLLCLESHPVYPAETPKVPSPDTTSCLSSTTITVTVPYPTGTGVPPSPYVPGKPSVPAAPYPSKPVGGAPYPSVPAGTGVPPAAGTGYPTKTGGYVKPSSPPEFTGAASALNVGGFVAGVGAFAAFFL
ncbi:hypothetical protein COCSADRAFT_30964 [Bipolaris sorokiniana ND90Pr]|uniref:Uncharacterized protein n=1 Tax=Cochliobolus sativus (strain ND90Pr / ATCC 201652) TaxID=665912 RepID=M2SPW4_COCSN|nr:uncharacterized protein COCSADRAFT_30964 [Bipolaris sorokiniana ND90Pr]EMD58807.1 hypothetical protein COCSADRAFT_30964 [Bipolaris sorokiniana ND90Pr]